VTRKSFKPDEVEAPAAKVLPLLEEGPLSKIGNEVNKVAHDKGWWLLVRSFGDITSLMHTEISEAFEEHRAGHKTTEVRVGDKLYSDPDGQDWSELEIVAGNGVKPEGIGIELADALIRILDYAAEKELDMDQLVRVKTAFNRTRPYRHGDKVV
jgi:hypothetical protein